MALHYLDRWSGRGAARGHQATYTQEDLERYLHGLIQGEVPADELRPDEGMPRSSTNPAESGNTAVSLMDMRRAWDRTDLDDTTRFLLIGKIGYGAYLTELAASTGLSVGQVGRCIDKGCEALLGALNGREGVSSE